MATGKVSKKRTGAKGAEKALFTYRDCQSCKIRESFGFQDEVALLKKSPDTREWFALKERAPIDSYKLPAVATAVGSQTKRNG